MDKSFYRPWALLVITAKSNSAGSKEIVLSLFSNTKLFVVFEQVKNVIHEIIFVGVLFIMQSVLECLLKYRNDIHPVCRWDELQRTLDFLYKLVPARHRLLVHVNFVRNYYAGYVRALVAHFLVPIPQILIRHLPVHVEHQNAGVRPKVVGRVQLIEGLLAGCVPNIYTV